MVIKKNSAHGVRLCCDSPACQETRRKRRQKQPRFLLEYTWLAAGLSLCLKCPECGTEHTILIEPGAPDSLVQPDGAPAAGAPGTDALADQGA